MKTKFVLTTLLSCTIIFSTTQAFAMKCQVLSISGTNVIFDCGKKAKRIKVGTSVTVTSKKKDGGGC